jgi:hypothetical protein
MIHVPSRTYYTRSLIVVGMLKPKGIAQMRTVRLSYSSLIAEGILYHQER